MTDLNQIQNRLNESDEEKRLFIENPVNYLEDKGVTITDADRTNLQRIVSDNSDFLNSAVSVGITVGT